MSEKVVEKKEEAKPEIIQVNGLVDNHTCRRLAPVIKDPGMKDPDDIVEYGLVQKVKKVGEGEDDYIVEDVCVEVSRVSRQAFIDKDADQVGVLNILEKVRRSGDVTLLNQLGVSPSSELQDYTNVPSNVGEALDAIKKGSSSFEGLKAIFGDISFETLAGMSSEQIAAVVSAYVAKSAPEAEKGGDK